MSREFAPNGPNAPGDNRVGRETGRRSDTANTPYCQSPVNTLPPVRTDDGQIFSEATQRVHGRRRSRRMVGTACISLLSCPCGRFLPIPGSHTDYCRELGPANREQSLGLDGPISESLPLLSVLGCCGLLLLKAKIVAEEKVPQLSDGRFRVRERQRRDRDPAVIGSVDPMHTG